ncbi:hypothetical protein GOP47_0019427 [Adiantum capillus-veneris]|uniref:Uncharacterized protein n=1 Tax=Adiantum capillus-veneris TaxID=13818 RepID=A0A9D4Z8L8_ADICA|nr:hypothetical protein GOP47_0019427 [Adiantum capillus-veneris]
MRAVSAGRVLSGELLWWELLVDASECCASRLKKSFWGSGTGAMKNIAVQRRQAQAVCLLDSTMWSMGKEAYAALVLNMKKLLLEARCTYGPVSASTGECCSTFSDFFSRGVAGRSQISSPFHKLMSLDALPSDGFSAMKLLKKMQQSCGTTFCSVSSHGLPEKNRNVYDKVYTDIYQGPGTDAYQAQADQGSKSNGKHFVNRACLSGSRSCLKEIHRNRHALPVSLSGRAFSTSTEKQFDDEIGDSQSSGSGQQHTLFGGQQSSPGDQQSSLGGQQSSLEVPESKPAGGPSWPNPDNAASYVLMSNIYADGDRWDEVKRINEMRLKARAWKKPGKAYIEIQAKVHEFIVGDRTHQDSINIYEKLRKIKRHMGHIGYVPYVDLVLENRSYHDPYSKPRCD